MADERDAVETASGTPPNGDAAETVPTETSEPTVESLQAELEDARHARELYEQTLQSLQAARSVPSSQGTPVASPPPTYDPVLPGTTLTRGQVDRIKARTGYQTDDEVVAFHRTILPFIEEAAGPLVGYVAQLADIADRHEARLSVDGYQELQDEIEKEVAAARQRGSVLPRTEIAQLVKARKLPAILAKEAERKQADRKAQAAQRRAQGGQDTTVQKVGPSAGSSGRASKDLDSIRALPTREDRIKALEELAGNRAG